MKFFVVLGEEGTSKWMPLNTREDLQDDYTYFIEQAVANPPQAGTVKLHKRFLRYALFAALAYTESVVNLWLYELEKRKLLVGAAAVEQKSLDFKMRAIRKAAGIKKSIPDFADAKALQNLLKHFKPGKDEEAFHGLSLELVQKTFADLHEWVSHMERVLAISRHPDNEEELKRFDEPIRENLRVELTTEGVNIPEMRITVLPQDPEQSK